MYRLIDIPISNCINSGIQRIFVLTQFMSVSLHAHIRLSYTFDHFSGGFVELLAAQETPSPGTDWYQGTADAVRKNLRYFDQPNIDYVVILSGDQLYRMDYGDLIATHRKSNADVTISCLPADEKAARGFGIMRIDDTGRVTDFVEKPKTEAQLAAIRTDPAWMDERGVQSKGRAYLASMGIYVFNRKVLHDVLIANEHADFGKEVFPDTIRSRHVQVHMFDGYWEDIGTIRSFYDANLALAKSSPAFRLTTPNAPIYTRARFLPPTKISGATIRQSMISNGCEIGKNAVIENSVIGLRTIIEPGVTIKDSIIMGCDHYEVEGSLPSESQVPMRIGAGCHIEGAIIDKNCRLGKNVKIINESARQETNLEHPICVIRDGIPVIVKGATLRDGWTLETEIP
jgi:glucose-1-phosphate adenylyltransferase